MLLAQQELLEVTPERRIIVPKGSTAWWGVDVSVHRVSIASVEPHGGDLERHVATISFAGLDGGARLAHAFTELRDHVAGEMERELTGEGLPVPGLVLVEQPSGKQPNLPLTYMVGVVQAAIYAGVIVQAPPPRVETCTSSWWKKKACGRGDIYKPKKGDKHEYGVLTWARLNGYEGSSWDEADAWAIAEAGRRFCALEPR